MERALQRISCCLPLFLRNKGEGPHRVGGCATTHAVPVTVNHDGADLGNVKRRCKGKQLVLGPSAAARVKGYWWGIAQEQPAHSKEQAPLPFPVSSFFWVFFPLMSPAEEPDRKPAVTEET